MPELIFKGKEFVFNHHLSVPYRPLLAHKKKSIGPGDMSGNLVIQGDNLHALKALLPHYAGRVDCIFIDPPYNTGNEGWSYNDNVNSPIMREWLSSNPVNKEDMLRHDKWLAMMWPRLKLMHELLSERGSLWMTLDDNEIHRGRAIIDEIFGEHNFVTTCIWHKMDSPKNTAAQFSEDHDYVLVYGKNAPAWKPNLLERSEEMLARYKNPDNDPRGPWLLSDLAARNYYAQGTYQIKTKSGRVIKGPPAGSYWRVSKENFERLAEDKRIWWGESGDNRPGIKRFLSEVKQGVVPQTLWSWKDVGSTRNAKQDLSHMMNGREEDLFITPKPLDLIKRIIEISTSPDSIVLDAFAGSGATGHAALSVNSSDSGDRRFILVESQDYADTLTAERMRRAIKGYEFEGTQREELLRRKLSWTELKKSGELLDHVQSIENLEAHRFDRIAKSVKDGELIVEGEKKISERVEGLGGEFTYCTLGEPLDLDKLLTGELLPDYQALGAWLFHTATGIALESGIAKPKTFYLGETPAQVVWLIYKPHLDFLKSPQAALTLEFAERIHKEHPNRKHLVFAAGKFASNRALLDLACEYAPLPFALFRT